MTVAELKNINMKQIILLILVIITVFSSCKKDKEIEKTYSISGIANLKDKEYWSDIQEIHIGIFNIDNQRIIKSSKIENSTNSTLNFSLNNIVEGTYHIKIFVYEKGQNKFTLIDYGTFSINQDLSLNEQALVLISYKRVQTQVFNSCIQCHGASSGQLASNLNLMPNISYQNLVNANSTNSTKLRVKPFELDSSFLIDVAKRNNINFDHPASQPIIDGDKNLLENWIIKGALND